METTTEKISIENQNGVQEVLELEESGGCTIEMDDEQYKDLVKESKSENDPTISITLPIQPADSSTIVKANHVPTVAKFEKVSFKTFLAAFTPIYVAMMKSKPDVQVVDGSVVIDQNELETAAHTVYDNIKLPQRATARSAGYDFFFPFGYSELAPGSSTTIPTGIKVNIYNNYMLKLYPKSGLGFKYRLQLDNTVGIIDADYYNNESNEGHIFVKITNDSRTGQTCCLDIGDAFCQGVFETYAIADDDVPYKEFRDGGLGSTGSEKHSYNIQ